MDTNDLYAQRENFYLKTSSTTRGGVYLCIVIGLVTFIAGMAMGEQTRTWGSMLFNLLFFFALALGGVVFSGMQDVVGAVWGRPVMRIHEGFASFLPVAAALLLGFFVCIQAKLMGAHEVYRWIADPSMLDHFWGKKDWLNPGFMIVRDIFALAVILTCAFWQLKTKLSGDLLMMRGSREEGERVGKEAKAKLRHWSGPVLLIYALAFTLLCFDLTMSLSPLWFSTLWGGWSFSVMMQTLMASLLLAMFALKSQPLGQLIRRQQFHDVGKLMHGFTIFFAYLTYAHILTYWYGNVPEETEYFLHRLHQPWLSIVIITPILAFVFPLFALLLKFSKWTAMFAIPIASTILFAQWMIYLLVVQPEVTTANGWNGWIEVGVFFGMLGLFMVTYMGFAKRFPMVSISDPLLPEALSDGHH